MMGEQEASLLEQIQKHLSEMNRHLDEYHRLVQENRNRVIEQYGWDNHTVDLHMKPGIDSAARQYNIHCGWLLSWGIQYPETLEIAKEGYVIRQGVDPCQVAPNQAVFIPR